MISAIQKIELRDGENVRLLITPSLFSIARRRKIAIETDNADDTAAALNLYIRIIWLSALNYAEAMQVEDPDYPDLPYRYVDFAEWAGRRQKDFYKMVSIVMEVLSGDKESANSGSDEKKNKD